MWFAESKYTDGNWRKLRDKPYTSQEYAKARCKQKLVEEPNNAHRLHFRTVADDERGTIYEESRPPHGSRLRWTPARW